MNKANATHNNVLFFPLFLIVLCSLVSFSGCSSAPRRADEVFVIRRTAANQLSEANHHAAHGRFLEALAILEDVRRLAFATDDPSLRINTAISRGNVLFALDRRPEAFVEWENAAAEADSSAMPPLAARARIYTIRAHVTLLSEATDSGADTTARAEALRAQVAAEIAAAGADKVSQAAGYLTVALAEKHVHRWAEAEAAARRALAIYEQARFLEDAAYAWFIIASIRSLSGKYDTALQALRTAIEFDRRAENGFGLASSWHAMGDIHRRTGRTEESRTAHRRAADIYRAIGDTRRAEELEVLLR